MNSNLIQVFITSIILSLAACGGGGGTSTPTPSADSNDSATAVRTSISAISSCSNGGITVEVGIDDNDNGLLDDAEVDSSKDVCNGADGRDALISLASLGAGATCAAGGILVESGPDLDMDGTLESNEVTATSPICNGANSSVSVSDIAYIIDLSSEDAGVNCVNGGTRIDSGNDLNLDSALTADEITSSAYVCNGVATVENTVPYVPENTDYDIAVNEIHTSTLVANDAESDRLEFIITQQPQYGQITEFNAMTGVFVFEPQSNFVGTDSFQYKVDDGRAMSSLSSVTFEISPVSIASTAFQIDTTKLSIVDYPDGVTAREFLIHGSTQNNVLTANLEAPAAISTLNLKALADEEENAASPLVTATLTQLPVASGTTAITITLFDGNDTSRTLGERKLSFTHFYHWASDGTNLTLTPDETQNGQAIYFTSDGELAVSLTLDSANANIVKVLNGNELAFDVVGLFEEGQLSATLSSGLFIAGAYTYKIEFDNIPIVDSYGNSFSRIEGMFQASSSPVPVTTNQSSTLAIDYGQLTQNSIQLSASGGTGPLSFSLVELASPGAVEFDDELLGSVIYTPLAPNLLVSDAFSFKVSDGLLETEIAKYQINIRDDQASSGNGSLKLIYDTQTYLATISWTDSWQEELGFKVEKYDFDCECWELAESLASSNLTGLPMSWVRSPSETSYYRVLVVLPEGEEVMSPGVLVAHVDELPTIVLDQAEPVTGIVNFSLADTPATVQGITYSVDLAQACSLSSSSYYYQIRYWPNFTCSYNTSSKAAGTHQLNARVSYQSGSYVDITSSFESLTIASETISSASRVLTGSSFFWTPPEGYYDVQVKASQESSGIANVALQLNDVTQPTKTQPNSYYGYSLDYCDIYPTSSICSGSVNAYTWRVNSTVAGTNPYEILITANDGLTRSITGAIKLTIPITLATPANDEISGSSLLISGSVGVTNNPVVITVSLGNAQLLTTEGPSFNTSYTMSDLPAGKYTLRITAQDVTSGQSSTLTRTLTYTP